MTSRVSVEEANAFMQQAFTGGSNRSEIILMEPDRAIVRLKAGPDHMRPGGYVSGPTQMTLADTSTYVAIFTRLGITPMTVTSNLNMTFLRPCIAETVLAEARLLKLGRTLAVAEVDIRGEGAAKSASHAVVTYSIPVKA